MVAVLCDGCLDTRMVPNASTIEIKDLPLILRMGLLLMVEDANYTPLNTGS